MNELIRNYLAGVDMLKEAVAGMTPEQLKARPIAGKWSTLEVVAHLADFEPILAGRMKRIIAMDKPLLLGANENQFAAALAYHVRDIADEMAIISSTRRQMARILSSLPPEAFQRQGVHSERGLVTLEQILTTTTRHIQHHVPFIQEKRKALRI
jgi:hypothetical protein